MEMEQKAKKKKNGERECLGESVRSNAITDYNQIGFLIHYFDPIVIFFEHQITQFQITMNDANAVQES